MFKSGLLLFVPMINSISLVNMNRALIEKFKYMGALRELAFWHRAKALRRSGCYHDWNYTKLGNQLGVSPDTARRRIKFLKNNGMVSFYGKNLYFNSLESVSRHFNINHRPVSILTGTSIKDLIDTFREELFVLEQKRQKFIIHRKDQLNVSQERGPRNAKEYKAMKAAKRNTYKSFGCPEVENMLFGSRATMAGKLGMSVSAFDKFARRKVREGRITKRYNYLAVMPCFGDEHFKHFLISKGGSSKYFVRLGVIYEQQANNYILEYHDNRFSELGQFFKDRGIETRESSVRGTNVSSIKKDNVVEMTRYDLPTRRTV